MLGNWREVLARRLPRGAERRFAGCLAFSLALHALLLTSFGGTGIGARGGGGGKRPAALAVSIRQAPPAVPEPVAESGQTVEAVLTAPPEPQPRPVVQSPNVKPLPVPAPTATTAAVAKKGAKLEVEADPAATGVKLPGAPAPERLRPGRAGIVTGSWYYAARYLHRRPTPLKPIRPDYPPLTNTLSGRVVLLMFINQQGGVDSHRILESTPRGTFDEEVLKSFANERYAPGLISGFPVKSQLLVEVVFEPGKAPRTGLLLDAPTPQ
ncbi:MAG: TonB family protein [Sulfuritalea sp.]|nr:TonB family protein [Sulfuritalea sp.]